jgi:hypothetical protein
VTGWRAAFVIACVVHLAALYVPWAAGPDTGIPGADKVVHLLLFAAVAYTGLRVGVPSRPLVAVLVVNAVLSEVVQHLVLPQRSGDAFDTMADLAGVALGAWAVRRAT